jgi:hypothetical protein
LEGDLTLHLLAEASASGLLHDLQIDPFSRKDLIQLNYVLNRLSGERQKAALEQELLISVMQQVCMAVANRKAYNKVADITFKLRDSLRAFIFPEKNEQEITAANSVSNENADLMQLWEKIFGPAHEVEQKFIAQANKRKQEDDSGLTREVERIVTHSLFKR